MSLIVNEIFESIQGEGVQTGLPTMFIRLAGCDLRCRWCDTPYALDGNDGNPMEISDIVSEAKRSGLELVCVTGGEPLIQKDTSELIRSFISQGYQVAVETNGASDISILPLESRLLFMSVDVKTPSSGESHCFLRSNLESMREFDQLKFIIDDDDDLDFALAFLSETLPACNVIFTPCHNEGGEWISGRLLDVLRTTEKGPFTDVLKKTRLMIQTHKVIWGPDLKGV